MEMSPDVTRSLVAGTLVRRAPRYLTEGHVAVERAIARHAEQPLADHVARHLGGAAADARRLAHEEVHARVPGVAVVVGPRRAEAAGDLVADRHHAGARDAVEQPGKPGGLVGHRARGDAAGQALLQLVLDHMEHP